MWASFSWTCSLQWVARMLIHAMHQQRWSVWWSLACGVSFVEDTLCAYKLSCSTQHQSLTHNKPKPPKRIYICSVQDSIMQTTDLNIFKHWLQQRTYKIASNLDTSNILFCCKSLYWTWWGAASGFRDLKQDQTFNTTLLDVDYPFHHRSLKISFVDNEL